MKALLFLSLCIISASCTQKQHLIIDISKTDSCYEVRDDSTKHQVGFGYEIVSNTLDDTIMLNHGILAPGKTGEVNFQQDYYDHIGRFCIDKLKAKKGSIKIAYYFTH